MNYSHDIEKVIAILKQVDSDYNHYYAAVGEKEKEICDLEHELELSAKDAKARAYISKELQKVLVLRRQYKDTVERAAPVTEFLAANPKLLSTLSALLGKVRKVEKYHETRQYTPRVRKDLTIG